MPTFSDDFTGSAGQKVLTRSGWTKYGSGWDGDGPEINGSNQVRTSAGTDTALIGQDTGSADCFVQATVLSGFSWPGAGNRRLLCARSWDRNDMWGAAYNSDEGVYEIWKCEGGVYSRAGTWAGPAPAGDVLRLEASGSTMTLKVNGTSRISITGITFGSTYTRAGVFLPAATTGVLDPVIDGYSSGDLGAAETTAPTLTGASASATSGTTSSGSVTTDEANGTLYWLTNTSSTATATAVKAGSSQAVTAAGAQSTSSTGLSPGTTYYTHFLHRDAAGNDSAVLSSASFATPALSASITLTTDGTTPAASLTGLTWGWWDAYPPNMASAPLVGGSAGTTNGSGVFTATLTGTTLTAGQTGTLLIVKGDGTEGSTANNAFCGPVVVG